MSEKQTFAKTKGSDGVSPETAPKLILNALILLLREMMRVRELFKETLYFKRF